MHLFCNFDGVRAYRLADEWLEPQNSLEIRGKFKLRRLNFSAIKPKSTGAKPVGRIPINLFVYLSLLTVLSILITT